MRNVTAPAVVKHSKTRLRNTREILSRKLSVSRLFAKDSSECESIHHVTCVLLFHEQRSGLTKFIFGFFSFFILLFQIIMCAGVAVATIYGKCATGTRECKPGTYCPDVANDSLEVRDLLRRQGGFATCSTCGSFDETTVAIVEQDDFVRICTTVAAVCARNMSACDTFRYIQCEACAYHDRVPWSGHPIYRTLQTKMCIANQAMGFDDQATLIVCMSVVILAVLDEIHEIRMFELLLRNAGLQRHTIRTAGLRVFLLEMHAWLRRYILVVIVLTVALLFTTFLDSDSFSLILNVIVLLFVFDIDNMCFKGLASVINVEALLARHTSDSEKAEHLAGGETALDIAIAPKDRRGLVWGQGSFLVIGTLGMVGWTYELACQADFIDNVAFIIDQDVNFSEARKQISSLLTTMVFASAITVCVAHALEAINRSGSLLERVTLIPVSLMEGYAGCFVIKETMLKIGSRRNGLRTMRTDLGVSIFYVSVVICALLGVLAATGMLRGGYRGGRKGKDDHDDHHDEAVSFSVVHKDESTLNVETEIESEPNTEEYAMGEGGKNKSKKKIRLRRNSDPGVVTLERDAGEFEL